MNLDLHIIERELCKYHLTAHYNAPEAESSAGYPVIAEDKLILYSEDVLYIINAVNLPSKTVFEKILNLLCIGKPADSWLHSQNNILYTEDYISPILLSNEIHQIFSRYYHWETEMQGIVDKGLPLRELGEVSLRFINNPIFLQGSSFNSIFHIVPAPREKYGAKLKEYHDLFNISDTESLTLEDINLLIADPEYNEAINAKEPSIYSGKPYGFRTLFYNIRIDNSPVARLCIDEIVNPITESDFVLIKILGRYLAKGIRAKDIHNFNRPKDLDTILENLLKHHLTEESRIISVLRNYLWNVGDSYFCMTVESKSEDNSEQVLKSQALHLTNAWPSDCYTIFSGKIVFIFNLTQSQLTQNEVLNITKPLLRDNLLTAGISSVFNDFKDLYYYYNQSVIAYETGKKIHPTFWYFKYENYILEHLIAKCSEKLIPFAIIPEGIKLLIQYDNANDTKYTILLKIFLENNMNIAETIRKVYIHRNTFLYRINRIKEISHLDFENTNVRLCLLISFKILEHKKSIP